MAKVGKAFQIELAKILTDEQLDSMNHIQWTYVSNLVNVQVNVLSGLRVRQTPLLHGVVDGMLLDLRADHHRQ